MGSQDTHVSGITLKPRKDIRDFMGSTRLSLEAASSSFPIQNSGSISPMSIYSHCRIRHANFWGTGAKPSPTYTPVGVGGTVDAASGRRFAKVAVTDTPGGVVDTPAGVADTPVGVADTPSRAADTPGGVTNGPELVLGPAAGDMARCAVGGAARTRRHDLLTWVNCAS